MPSRSSIQATDSAAAMIGAGASGYVGSENLGGGSSGVFKIDTRPLEMLAQYTYNYQTKMFDEEQKNLERMAKESSEFAAYDLTNAIPKYAKEVRDDFDAIFKWAQDNPDVKSYSKNPKGYDEWKKKLSDLSNKIKDGASQEIIYKAAQAKIEAETRPEVKAFLQKQLDDQIAANDIKTPLKIQQYGAEPAALPEVPTKKFDVIRMSADGKMIVDREQEVADRRFIKGTAAAIALGLTKDVLDETSEQFKKLSPEAQQFKRQEFEKAKATGRLAELDQAKVITETLQNFRDPQTGKIDMAKVMASNEIISGSIAAIDVHNQLMREEKTKIKAGYYSDNMRVLKFGVNALDEKDYAEIDYSDGTITATDLLEVKLSAKAPVATYKTVASELDNWYKEETLDINRQKLAIDLAEFGLKKAAADKANTEDLVDARSVINEMAGIINNGVETKVEAPGDYKGETKTHTVLRISDPVLLKQFGTIEKDGNVTNVPNYVSIDKKTSQLKLGYYKNTGDDTKDFTRTGGRVIDKEIALDQRTWANTILDRQLGAGKDKSGVRSIFENVLAANNNSVFEMSQKIKGVASQEKKEGGAVELSGKIDASTLKTGQSYIVNGKTYIWNGSKLKPQ